MPEIIVKLGEEVVNKYFFDKEILNIGRARDNDIIIENLAVSRNHARIRLTNGKYVLTDLNSANGTFVNGVRITKTEIMHNDVITVGKHNLLFVNKPLSEEQIISDAFGADRTMIVDRAPCGLLVVTTGKQRGQEFKLSKHENHIGRSADNDIRLHDWFVSKHHCVIIKQGNNYFIKDLGSWRGVFVNNQPIKDTQLKEGDDIKLGATHLTFHLRVEEPLRITGRVPKELAYEEVREALSPLAAEPTSLEAEMGEEVVLPEAASAIPELPPEIKGEEVIAEVGIPEKAFIIVEEKEEMAVVEAATKREEKKEKKEKRKRVKEIEENHQKEIKLWESALKNKSPIIRREAARNLKKLTGKNYEY